MWNVSRKVWRENDITLQGRAEEEREGKEMKGTVGLLRDSTSPRQLSRGPNARANMNIAFESTLVNGTTANSESCHTPHSQALHGVRRRVRLHQGFTVTKNISAVSI